VRLYGETTVSARMKRTTRVLHLQPKGKNAPESLEKACAVNFLRNYCNELSMRVSDCTCRCCTNLLIAFKNGVLHVISYGDTGCDFYQLAKRQTNWAWP
jgi:hypothetical protein